MTGLDRTANRLIFGPVLSSPVLGPSPRSSIFGGLLRTAEDHRGPVRDRFSLPSPICRNCCLLQQFLYLQTSVYLNKYSNIYYLLKNRPAKCEGCICMCYVDCRGAKFQRGPVRTGLRTGLDRFGPISVQDWSEPVLGPRSYRTGPGLQS